MKNLRERAIELRQRGWSYNVIAERLDVAKSTLSGWLREVPYAPNAKVLARIRAGPAASAIQRQKRRLQQLAMLRIEAATAIGNLSQRDLWLLGIGLYLGEGSRRYEIVQIINSDPQIIKLAIRWFKEICGVPTDHMSIAVHAYPDIVPNAAIAYWSRCTNIPRVQFERVQVDRRQGKSSRKRRYLPFGTARVTIRSHGHPQLGVALHRRIMAWTHAVFHLLRV